MNNLKLYIVIFSNNAFNNKDADAGCKHTWTMMDWDNLRLIPLTRENTQAQTGSNGKNGINLAILTLEFIVSFSSLFGP